MELSAHQKQLMRDSIEIVRALNDVLRDLKVNGITCNIIQINDTWMLNAKAIINSSHYKN